ncbi:helix-turn-helix transcriptional regulator [Chryseolinea sp. T2]|uniref:helix-turn-helix domain-containing protein n=1 Tax=Chryseolinea sp. T2 TaxID=3129255 RepID=UPI00307824A2
MGNANSIQTLFLEEVRKSLPSNRSFVDELAEALSISKDSAYRRIRGETVLSLDEAKKLCDYSGVSIDTLFSPTSKTVPFIDHAAGANLTLEQWLNSILKSLSAITDIIYAARDIPIFHLFRKPELAAFKLFFWQKTVMSNPAFLKQAFDPDAVPKEMLLLGERIWRKYTTIPSIEIWGAEAAHNTLKQIQFYEDCGFFAQRSQASRLCDELVDLLATIQAEASDARKTDGSTFNLYHNEVLTTDNLVFTRTRDGQLTFINYNGTGLLATRHNGFCDNTHQYLISLIKHSTLISGTAEKERIKLFSRMTRSLTDFRATVPAQPLSARVSHDGRAT